MTQTNAIKWDRIRQAAIALGVGDWAIRKWSQRGKVPPKWQIEIAERLRVKPSRIVPPIKSKKQGATHG
jgi:hypothetical protein